MAEGKFFDRFYFRDHRNANRFRPNVTPPRLNFNGFVEFGFSPEVAGLGEVDDSLVFREQISSLLQTATLPSASFNTVIKNQYNIKRVVNTGVEYNPVEINVLDTANNEWALVIMKYYNYMYLQGRNKLDGETRDVGSPVGYKSNAETLTAISDFMQPTFESNAAGLNISNEINFFNHIKIVVYHAGRGTEYVIFKPTLTEFNMGEIDYTSSETRKFTLRFDYENFTINNSVNFKVSDDDKLRFEQINGDAFSWMEDESTLADNFPINSNSGDDGNKVTFTGRESTPRNRSGQTFPRNNSGNS